MLNNLQILRALAALNVVLFHIIGISRTYGQPTSLHLLDGWGGCGVDVFFVISGFVMVYTQARKHKSPFDFFKDRVLRVVPIYWLLTLLLLGIAWSMPSVFRSGPPTMEHIVSSLFFVSGVVTHQMPILYVGWSLEYEMLFYTLFALGLMFGRNRLAFLLPIIALAISAMLGWSYAMVMEFVFGMVVARVYLAGKLQIGLPLVIAGALMLGASIFWKPDLDRLFVWGIPSILLVHGAVNMRQSTSRWLVYLGGASYSIYLVQVMTIPAFYKVSSRFLGAVPADVLALLALASTVAFACLTYQWVERPLAALFNKKPRSALMPAKT